MTAPTVDVPTASEPRSMIGAALAVGVLAAATLVAVLGLLVVAGVVVPSAGVVGVMAPEALYAYGPLLLLGGAVGTVGAIATAMIRRRSVVITAVAALCVVSVVSLGALVGLVLTSTAERGGSVNLVRASFPSQTTGGAVDDRFVYAAGADGRPLHMSVVRPAAGSAGAPIMVWVHGGGWIGGSDLSRAADMRYLADRGWLGISVEYTLARPGLPTWNIDGPEIACALTQVVDRARDLGADPSRVALAGDSAGGQLAISVAYHAAAGDQPSSCGGVVPIPRAVIGDYPAVDLVEGYDHGARSSNPGLDSRYLAVSYTGGTPSQVPDRYRAVSGQAAITAHAPPSLVVGPDRDVLVPPSSLRQFVGAARSHGVDATLVTVPFANHAFDTFGDGSLGQQVAFSILERWAGDHTRS